MRVDLSPIAFALAVAVLALAPRIKPATADNLFTCNDTSSLTAAGALQPRIAGLPWHGACARRGAVARQQ